MQRREFVKWIGVSATTILTEDFARWVPADKKLSPAWIQSLFSRGEKTVYRGKELETIGMPIGGLYAGQLYLGGDGKLWHWDIFNQQIGTEAKHYADPLKPSSPLEQGFGVRILSKERTTFHRLDRTGFSDIAFRGEYPIGLVEYRDAAVPVTVSLEAFSPLVPLDVDRSSLPATVMRFTVNNTSNAPVELELLGWLENAVCLQSKNQIAGKRRNRIVRSPAIVLVESSATAEAPPQGPLPPDHGTMVLGLLGPQEADAATADLAIADLAASGLGHGVQEAIQPLAKQVIGGIGRKLLLGPKQATTATFVLAWHFPNLQLKDGGRFYATRFGSAAQVAEHVATNFDSLHQQTRLWRDTWYDSTLPYWFLDRTFLNTSILATSTSHRFANGRFYGWEGVGCCEGTCTHVWHYAHAVARLFPQLERDLRQRTDFGTALNPTTGIINHRGEGAGLAVDGQAGCILRAFREHQMSADSTFLQSLWPKIKTAMQCLVHMDDGKGMLQGAQHNTLDQPWFGKVAWLSSLYVAAARACEEMAKEMGDETYAQAMRTIVERGSKAIDRELFNGEYYYQIADSAHAKSVGSHNGCEIDQVFGQSWAFQVGLGRILDRQNVKKALASLWKYNFTPDVGPFRNANKPGRWYAMAGEGGLLMCSWPKGDAARVQQGYDYYFNECMTGFEYQVAGHMIWEGMVQEGLAITRAIHDRYHAARRNPWNEVECGDHYARAMASYGVFLAACGYEYHGPARRLAFDPRLTPNDFRAAFTTAEGWGSFSQKRNGASQLDRIELRWGQLAIRTIVLGLAPSATPTKISVAVNGESTPLQFTIHEGRITIELRKEARLVAGQAAEISIE